MAKIVAKLSDNSLGTWKLNLAKSKRTPPGANPPTTLIVVYEAAGEGVKSTVTGQLKDGTTFHFAGPIR